VDVEEQQVRELYGLKTSEPNILFALCCGIRSSPAVSTLCNTYIYIYITITAVYILD
jgi:putative lipase involved disintegration of autophagic bodies